MRQTWRWFGPQDEVSVDAMLQAGVEGVVSALHHVPPGEVWTTEEIEKRQREIATMRDGAPSGLEWEVVESLPVSEDIKKQWGDWRRHLENYQHSLGNLSAAGIEVVCYNFMPVLDWTRTDLAWRLPTGATCMRFDAVDFAVFDVHLLERPGAAEELPDSVVAAAAERFGSMDDEAKTRLAHNVVCGLPGAAESWTLEDVREHLRQYDSISADQLRGHFTAFLEEVVPVAEEVGIRLCCHPDDPPFPLLGLPRIVSTESDYRWLLDAVDRPANGMTLCSGSLGARADNDVVGMMQRFGDRVHFLHLRNVKRESVGSDGVFGSFYEDEHLGGDTDMVALIARVLDEEARRRGAGRTDAEIPMRPDHGWALLDDLGRSAQPGYAAIGRLRGLAELRGVQAALRHQAPR